MFLELCTTAKTAKGAENREKDDAVRLEVGEIFCVPKGMQHRPVAEEETQVLVIEKIGTVNTGDQEGSERIVYVDEGGR
jgi:mannose-6-phosphate isomerase-like protein (cupin superfamily)